MAYRSVAHFPAIVAARSRMMGTNGIRTRNSPGQNRGCFLALLTHPWVIDVERLRSGSLLLFDRRPAGTAKIMGDPIEPSPPTKLLATSGFGVLIALPIIKAIDGEGACTIGELTVRLPQRPTSKRDMRTLLSALADEGLVSVSGDGPSAVWDVTPVGRDWARAAEQRAALHSMVALHDFESSKPAAAPVEDRG